MWDFLTDAIENFDMGIRVTDPANMTATAGIFATYPQSYLSAGEGFVDQVQFLPTNNCTHILLAGVSITCPILS